MIQFVSLCMTLIEERVGKLHYLVFSSGIHDQDLL